MITPETPRLVALATAVPPYRLRQADVMTAGRRLFDGAFADLERLLEIYTNAAIETRYSCVPIEWYEQEHGFAERNHLYVENAVGLLERATRACLQETRLRPADIDTIVAVSTSGIATPSLEALLMERLAFRRDVQRLPIFGLGCAGGVLGLARAAAFAQAAPGSTVLFLVVELCALTFRQSDRSKSNLVATALFGDGAAAGIVRCGGEGPALTGWGEHTWPRSLDIMGWNVVDDGLAVVFSRDIPALVRTKFRDTTNRFLASQGLTVADVDRLLCHPGGAKVVDALENAFDLPRGALVDSRSVLKDYGNMSAATVLFVLERALQDGARGRHLMSSLGPGFTAGFLLLET
ncbi:MAG: type III polyketide synthase [Alphaproteobacteria bacterium]